MTAAIMTLGLALALGGVGQHAHTCSNCAHRQDQERPCLGPDQQHVPAAEHGQRGHGRSAGWILPPGPGDGWGFPNGNPHNAGWFEHGHYLPLGGDRTGEYYFPRYFAVPPEQMFPGTDYNPYVNRGQRYLPFVGAGGAHPAGCLPQDTSQTPVRPYTSMDGSQPTTTVPVLRGRVDAPPLPASGGTGLTP